MKKFLAVYFAVAIVTLVFSVKGFAQKNEWVVSSYLENIREVQEDVNRFVSGSSDFLVEQRGDKDYLLPAISPKARVLLREKYAEYDTEGKIDAAFDRLAASVVKPMQTYFPGSDNFRFNNAADIKTMKAALKNLGSLTIFKIGVFDSIWNIETNALGLPERRYKRGYVWAKDTSDNHPYCVRYEVRLIQNYAGAGTYGETFGWKDFDSRARTIMGCPAGAAANPKTTSGTENVSDLMTQTVDFYTAKNYPETIKAATKVIKLKPDNESSYFYRGVAYYETKQYALAVADYTKAISLSTAPNILAENTYNRCLAYTDLGNATLALADCTKAITLDPNYYLAYFQRGNLYYNSGKTSLAVKDYSKTIELNFDYALAYAYRADCYDKLGQTQLANQDRETAKSLEQ